MCAREFAAWADKVDSLKRAGKFAEAVRLCRKHYPFPYAFTNAAIAIRRQISEHRKEKSDWTHLLEQLYHNAVCEDFFSSIKWADVIDNNLASSTAALFTERISAPYQNIGYERLRQLNQTDRKWLVEAWGEPSAHATPRGSNDGVFAEAVQRFKLAAKESSDELFGSHGLERPPKGRSASSASAGPKASGRGCLAIVVAPLVLTALMIWKVL